MSTPEEVEIARLMMEAADMMADTGVQPDDPRAWAHLLMYCPRELIEARLAQLVGNRLKRIESDFEHMVAAATAPGNYDCNPYMWGMANGLILGQGIIKDITPQYLDAPIKWLELEGNTNVETGTRDLGSDAAAAECAGGSVGTYEPDRAAGERAGGNTAEGDQPRSGNPPDGALC